MLTSSLWTSKIPGARGTLSAHKLIPIAKFSRARPSDRASQHQKPKTNNEQLLPYFTMIS